MHGDGQRRWAASCWGVCSYGEPGHVLGMGMMGVMDGGNGFLGRKYPWPSFQKLDVLEFHSSFFKTC